LGANGCIKSKERADDILERYKARLVANKLREILDKVSSTGKFNDVQQKIVIHWLSEPKHDIK